VPLYLGSALQPVEAPRHVLAACIHLCAARRWSTISEIGRGPNNGVRLCTASDQCTFRAHLRNRFAIDSAAPAGYLNNGNYFFITVRTGLTFDAMAPVEAAAAVTLGI